MLEHLLIDAGIVAGGIAADDVSTYFTVRKFGVDFEAALYVREGMRREGICKHLTKNSLQIARLALIAGAALYGFDCLTGIQDNLVNAHHAVLFPISGLKYVAAVANTLRTFGMYKTANIVGFPVLLAIKYSPLAKHYDLGGKQEGEKK